MRIYLTFALALIFSSFLLISCSEDETPPAEEYTTKSETEVYAEQPNATDVTEEKATEPMQPEEDMSEHHMAGNETEGDEVESNMTEGAMDEESAMTEGEKEEALEQNRTEI